MALPDPKRRRLVDVAQIRFGGNADPMDALVALVRTSTTPDRLAAAFLHVFAQLAWDLDTRTQSVANVCKASLATVESPAKFWGATLMRFGFTPDLTLEFARALAPMFAQSERVALADSFVAMGDAPPGFAGVVCATLNVPESSSSSSSSSLLVLLAPPSVANPASQIAAAAADNDNGNDNGNGCDNGSDNGSDNSESSVWEDDEGGDDQGDQGGESESDVVIIDSSDED